MLKLSCSDLVFFCISFDLLSFSSGEANILMPQKCASYKHQSNKKIQAQIYHYIYYNASINLRGPLTHFRPLFHLWINQVVGFY